MESASYKALPLFFVFCLKQNRNKLDTFRIMKSTSIYSFCTFIRNKLYVKLYFEQHDISTHFRPNLNLKHSSHPFVKLFGEVRERSAVLRWHRLQHNIVMR